MTSPLDIDGVLVTYHKPMVPFDGRWHRWSGRRLAHLCDDGVGYAIKRVALWRWVIRYGGTVPNLLREQPHAG